MSGVAHPAPVGGGGPRLVVVEGVDENLIEYLEQRRNVPCLPEDHPLCRLVPHPQLLRTRRRRADVHAGACEDVLDWG